MSLIDQFGNLISPDFAKYNPPVLSLKGSGSFDINVVDRNVDEGESRVLQVRRSSEADNSEASEVEDREWAVDIPLIRGEVDLWSPEGQRLWENGVLVPTKASGSRRSTRDSADPLSEVAAARRPKLQCYVLSSSKFTLEGSLPVTCGSNIQWHVTSSIPSISGCDVESVIVAGRPHSLKLRQQNTGDFSKHQAVVISSTQEQLSLEMQLYDKNGNIPTLQNKLYSIQVRMMLHFIYIHCDINHRCF